MSSGSFGSMQGMLQGQIASPVAKFSQSKRCMSFNSSRHLTAFGWTDVMSSSCASLKSVVIQEWVKAAPRPTGCGVSERSPEPLQRRLSFSMPRLSSATQEGLVSIFEKMFLSIFNEKEA